MNLFDNMFGNLKPGMCRLSMDGKIAVKTSHGYRAYNIKDNRLVNCDSFVFDIGEEMFFDIVKVHIADDSAKDPQFMSRIEKYHAAEETAKEIIRKKDTKNAYNRTRQLKPIKGY